MDEEDRENRNSGPTFEPPVYKQRYNFVEKIVREFGAKKVHDIVLLCGKHSLTCFTFVCLVRANDIRKTINC
jgi:hypothetical protein